MHHFIVLNTFSIYTAIIPKQQKLFMYFQSCFPQLFFLSFISNCIVFFLTDGKHSILLFKHFFSLFWRSDLSLFLWYITRKFISVGLFIWTPCSQRSKIPFCPHYSCNWTITSTIFLSSSVSRHFYWNIIDFHWHLQSMSICLVMAVNICFDATLAPVEQSLHSQNVQSISLCQCATADLEGLH